MTLTAADLARRLADRAETVCRHYLSNGRREGAYWLVGDVDNAPGRSLYVRLTGPPSGRGAQGRWMDAATGQHGELLDLIGLSLGHTRLGEALDEARRWLALPDDLAGGEPNPRPSRRRSHGSSERAARRLYAMASPLLGTLGETYLHARGLDARRAAATLRFHSGCYYRPASTDAPDTATAWPAIIAPVTDLAGRQTGAHRTWLDRQGRGKAPIATPRRAMGALAGGGVRFGVAQDVLAAGEGLETILSLGDLAVVSKKVVHTLPGREAFDAGVGAVEIIAGGPRLDGASAFVRAGVGSAIGPFAQAGLNEAFGLAVGPGRVGSSPDVSGAGGL